MTSLSIGGRRIASDAPVFVVAEIGVNHDGSIDRALELVRYAAVAGADAVKLQIFQARALMHPSAAFADYQAQQQLFSDPTAMLRQYELRSEDVARIVCAIRERGMIPLATPFSLSDIPILSRLEFPAVKIASPDIVNWPLLRRCAALGWPMLIS